MSDSSYTSSIKKVVIILKLVLVYLACIGRSIAPDCLEIEEIGGLNKYAIGNWSTNVFGIHYNTKLPKPAMCIMSGRDSRRGHFIHQRSFSIAMNHTHTSQVYCFHGWRIL